jgi:4a-hydroxytetrahydrobiopterin dehydratase
VELRLEKNQVRVEMAKLRGWKLRGKQISRLYVFEGFMQGIRFIDRVARLAEEMNHHPDIDIRYNKIRLTLTTHDEGGLTMKDFRLASKIDRIKPK